MLWLLFLLLAALTAGRREALSVRVTGLEPTLLGAGKLKVSVALIEMKLRVHMDLFLANKNVSVSIHINVMIVIIVIVINVTFVNPHSLATLNI